tara:strand:- start:227 stop:2074 length:1848 start_codon:yes stop_codon:yes gene_type:complete
MAPRKNRYMETFSADYRMAVRWQEIQGNIKNSQEQYAQLQNLLEKENSNLQRLEETFRIRVNPDQYAVKLLEGKYAADLGRLQSETALSGAIKSGSNAPSSILKAASDFDISKQSQPNSPDEASLVRKAMAVVTGVDAEGKGTATKQEVQATLKVLADRGIDTSPVVSAAGKVTNRKSLPSSSEAVSKAAMEQDASIQALDALKNAGPMGYLGGQAAENAAIARANQKAPDGSSFTTAQDALDAYVNALSDDGDASDLMDKVSQEDFDFAERLYGKAKREKSYQRQDQKLFDDTYLSQKARVANLTREIEEKKKTGAIQDPAKEAALRELKARGVDISDPHAKFIGTPTHGYLSRADELYAKAPTLGDLTPKTSAEKRAMQILDVLKSKNPNWKIADLEKMMRRRFVAPGAREGAIAFALAHDRIQKEEEAGIVRGDQNETKTAGKPSQDGKPFGNVQKLTDAERAEKVKSFEAEYEADKLARQENRLKEETEILEAIPTMGNVGFRFKDPTDVSETEYERTADGFKVLSGPHKDVEILGGTVAHTALSLAEKGDADAILKLQAKLNADRAKANADKAKADKAPKVEADKAPKVEDSEIKGRVNFSKEKRFQKAW